MEDHERRKIGLLTVNFKVGQSSVEQFHTFFLIVGYVKNFVMGIYKISIERIRIF